MAKNRGAGSLVNKLHPLLQGYATGVFAGGVLLAIAVSAGGFPGDPSFLDAVGYFFRTLLLCFQLVMFGLLPTLGIGLALYRWRGDVSKVWSYTILGTAALVGLIALRLVSVSFAPPPGPNLAFVLFSVAFVVASALFWAVTTGAEERRREKEPNDPPVLPL